VTTLPAWLQALHARSPGETPGDHCARIVRAVAGCSLDHLPDKLADIYLLQEPDRDTAVEVSRLATNCGTSMRAVYALAGCTHTLITRPYRIGTAVAWVLGAATELGALLPASSWRKCGPGWGLWYGTPAAKGKSPRNDDHMEWCLAVPDEHGVALHGGGGRARNAITIGGPGTILWSTGKPLRGVIDPERMMAG